MAKERKPQELALKLRFVVDNSLHKVAGNEYTVNSIKWESDLLFERMNNIITDYLNQNAKPETT